MQNIRNIQNRAMIIAMTGASGAAYGLRLMQKLLKENIFLHVLLSDAACVVLKQECDLLLPEKAAGKSKMLAEYLGVDATSLCCYEKHDWFSPAASGSSNIRQMVVVPCSMGTLAGIANGISDHLIERAADVMIKERKQLILVPRETPLSAIHLEHMLKLSRLGVDMIPAMPGFYHRPKAIDELIDFMVDRILDHLHVNNAEAKRWGE
ncbi:MAG: flavin prenyltransferase UbiX [Mariprofundaceae bacterium]|nr:flavin prenyltransferase UbiX [Mariprofundaceae bacterium]